jgi:ABC-2 type transport system permease protein
MQTIQPEMAAGVVNRASMIGPRIFVAFLRRDWLKARSYRASYVLQFAAIFFHLTLYYFLGKLFDRSSISNDPALSQGYFAFYFVGSIMMQFVSFALSVFSTNLANEQTAGSLEALLATPPSAALLLSAGIGYQFLLTLATQVVALLTAVLFFDLNLRVQSVASAAAIVLAWLATLVIFGSAGLGLAAFTIVYKRGVSMPIDFLMTGLGLACGIYYPIDILPGALQFISKLLPLTWSLTAIRDAVLHNQIDLGLLGLLIACGALAAPIGVRIFTLGLNRARQQGSLGQF